MKASVSASSGQPWSGFHTQKIDKKKPIKIIDETFIAVCGDALKCDASEDVTLHATAYR